MLGVHAWGSKLFCEAYGSPLSAASSGRPRSDVILGWNSASNSEAGGCGLEGGDACPSIARVAQGRRGTRKK